MNEKQFMYSSISCIAMYCNVLLFLHLYVPIYFVDDVIKHTAHTQHLRGAVDKYNGSTTNFIITKLIWMVSEFGLVLFHHYNKKKKHFDAFNNKFAY